MRRTGLCTVILLAAGGVSLQAQRSNPGAPPASETVPTPQDAQQPQTPDQQLEQQVRQVDPLDRSEDKDSKTRDRAGRDAEKRRDQDQPPTPGSIAAGERDGARRQSPQIVADDGSSDEPVQEYTG